MLDISDILLKLYRVVNSVRRFVSILQFSGEGPLYAGSLGSEPIGDPWKVNEADNIYKFYYKSYLILT